MFVKSLVHFNSLNFDNAFVYTGKYTDITRDEEEGNVRNKNFSDNVSREEHSHN